MQDTSIRGTYSIILVFSFMSYALSQVTHKLGGQLSMHLPSCR